MLRTVEAISDMVRKREVFHPAGGGRTGGGINLHECDVRPLLLQLLQSLRVGCDLSIAKEQPRRPS